MLDRTKPDAEKLGDVKRLWTDRNWRINHAYYVQDEAGTRVLYRRRKAQQMYADAAWYFDVIPKARQLGFSTEIAMEITDLVLFRKDTKAGIIDMTLEDAKKKLSKIRYAYENLPRFIRSRVGLVKDNEDEMRFTNGSSVEVGTTHRGGTLQYLHVSEYGKIAAESPERAEEIKTGAFQTVHAGQQIKVESTAHGTSGEFAEMVKRARDRRDSGLELGRTDFKLHFFGWFLKDEYRERINLVIVSQELGEYFAELEGKHGIKLDGEQKAWYAKKLGDLGEDKMREEFPSHIDELFFNSLAGAYFKKELSKARKDERIGFLVPHDPTRRVHTCWDKGMNEQSDRNAIWWFQTDGVRYRFIDYYENAGEGIQHYAKVVLDKARTREFNYGTHFGPHDLKNRDWGNNAKTMLVIAAENGINFTLVPRVQDKADSIEQARRLIGMSWFDAEHCERGVDALDNYRKQWSKVLGQWTNKPLHDWASNGADAYQCGAMGEVMDKPERRERGGDFGGRKRGSQWAG